MSASAPAGRRHVTTREAIEAAAFVLFERDGFDATTVDAIAEAAGIGRRTFFRYFASKNDVVWGDWDGEITRMRRRLAQSPRDAPLAQVLSDAVVDYNRIAPGQAEMHRRRLWMILRVPALQAHSTLRYAEWRAAIADFVAERRGDDPRGLDAQLTAYVALGAAVTAYEQWLQDPEAGSDELTALMRTALRRLDGWARD